MKRIRDHQKWSGRSESTLKGNVKKENIIIEREK